MLHWRTAATRRLAGLVIGCGLALDAVPGGAAEALPEPGDRAAGAAVLADSIPIVRRQIQSCWRIPQSVTDATDIIVLIELTMAPDGMVQSARVREESRFVDPRHRAVLESALQAVLDRRCQPLRLPPQHYDLWRTIELLFRPGW